MNVKITQKCAACWKEERPSEAKGWIFFGFKHLESGWLCPQCQIEWKEHYEKLQAANL